MYDRFVSQKIASKCRLMLCILVTDCQRFGVICFFRLQEKLNCFIKLHLNAEGETGGVKILGSSDSAV